MAKTQTNDFPAFEDLKEENFSPQVWTQAQQQSNETSVIIKCRNRMTKSPQQMFNEFTAEFMHDRFEIHARRTGSVDENRVIVPFDKVALERREAMILLAKDMIKLLANNNPKTVAKLLYEMKYGKQKPYGVRFL
jgi:hypothetical protein